MRKLTQFYFILGFFLLQISVSGFSAIYLESISATSSHLDSKQYSIENIFDGKPSVWASMPGAGPDEGIMIYFQKPEYISKLEIKQPAKGNFSSIKTVSLYINGSEAGEFNADQIITINQNVKSLFIRIVSTDGLKTIQEGEFSFEVNQNSLPVAIEEINFLNANNQKIDVVAPVFAKGSVKASSILKPEEAYHTDYLFDSRKEFGWADGNEKKSGDGEWLSFHFENEITLSKIKIYNGYQRSQKHFQSNERLKKISFGLENSSSSDYWVADSQEPQIISFNQPLTGKNFVLKVKEVHKGSSYKDLVTSELSFFDGKNWVLINTGGQSKRQADLIKKVSISPLSKVIDKRIFQTQTKEADTISTSLILRSNGSFVIWSKTQTPDSSEQLVADGNWEIKQISKDEVKIRIFGKKHNLKTGYERYKGQTSEEQLVIFQDFIIVSSNMIKAEKTFLPLTIK